PRSSLLLKTPRCQARLESDRLNYRNGQRRACAICSPGPGRGGITLATVTGRTTFPDISSRAWEHPADRVALTALRRLKGFDQVLKVLAAMLRERQHRLLYLASAAQAGPRQFADLDALLD